MQHSTVSKIKNKFELNQIFRCGKKHLSLNFNKKTKVFHNNFFFFLTSCIITITSLFSCSNEIKKLPAIEINDKEASAVFYNFDIIYSDSGKIETRITGDTLKQFNKTDERKAYDLMLGNVHLKFFEQNGDIKSEMKAQRTIRYEEEGNMFAYEQVIVYNKLGEKLNTEYLVWDAKKERITTNQAVKITKKDQILYGDSLISDQFFLDYEIANPKGEFILNEQD